MSREVFQSQAAETAARFAGVFRGPDLGKRFSDVASEVAGRVAYGEEPTEQQHDADWQRVNSYIADVVKDAHVLYSKLARLQGDFIGGELDHLEKISSKVLDLGEQLSTFMKAFHEGDASMMKEKQFGGGQGGGAPSGTPPPAIPSEFKRPEEDFETDLDLEGDGDDFKGFDEEDKGDGDEQGQGQQK